MTKREFAAEFVEIHVTDGIGTLLLVRPPRNALTRQMCREIAAAAAELGERPDVNAVIVYGGHEVFCTGDDDQMLADRDAFEAVGADLGIVSIPKSADPSIVDHLAAVLG